MNKLDRREWCIVFEFILACFFILMAIVDWLIGGGTRVYDFVELSFLAFIMSRVL